MLLVARIYLPEQLQSMVVCSSMLPMNMVPVYSHHQTFLVQSPRELSQAPYFFLESFFSHVCMCCQQFDLFPTLAYSFLLTGQAFLFIQSCKITKVTPKEVRIHNTRTFSTALATLFYVPRKQTKNYSPGFIDI